MLDEDDTAMNGALAGTTSQVRYAKGLDISDGEVHEASQRFAEQKRKPGAACSGAISPPAIHHLMSKAAGWLTTTGCLDEVSQCFKWLAACWQAGLGAHRFQLTAAPWPVACRLCAQAAAL